MQRICDFIAQWMGVIVLMVAALSLVVPASLAWIGMKSHIQNHYRIEYRPHNL